MSVWPLTSNQQIDNFAVGKWAPYIVVRIRSYVDVHTVTRKDNSTFQKFTFTVDNGPQEEGSEKVIHCTVRDNAVKMHAPLIEANPNALKHLQVYKNYATRRYIVVRIRSYVDVHTVTRKDNSTFQKFTFTVDNGPQEEGSEKVIHCTVRDNAVKMHAPLIEANPNAIICIQNAFITEKNNEPGNTPFSLSICKSTKITPLGDSNRIDEANQNKNSSRPRTSGSRNTELTQPSESPIGNSETCKKRSTDFYEELKAGFLHLDAHKRRKLEVEILFRLHSTLLD